MYMIVAIFATDRYTAGYERNAQQQSELRAEFRCRLIPQFILKVTTSCLPELP